MGQIHSFESLAAVDGEGLRCAVFFAGCPLRCAYCHNPDTWAPIGTQMSAHDLVKKIARYKPYFGENGGVTFSGGEPLLQASFIEEMMPLLKKQSISYAVDTSGAVVLSASVKNVLKQAQLVLLDLKFWDDESYRFYTGHDMRKTLAMLDYLNEINQNVWIRTVIIPGVNDNEEALLKYLPYIKNKPCVKKYELLAFHTMGFYKYENLGIINSFSEKKDLDNETKARLQAFVERHL